MCNITVSSDLLIIHGSTKRVQLSSYNNMQVMFICKMSEKQLRRLCRKSPAVYASCMDS